MKKIVIVLFAFSLMAGGISVQAAYAGDCTKDTPIDQAGDWFATLGKKDVEKQAVLAQRKADRLTACAKRQAEKAAKEAQKAGNDLKKKMGF
ncbi:MAG TPA: hypothetical protein PLO78_05445 [Candidatus Omnitrophota bacterium]|nr:hypothetical protein [Candidatus Omnitrophota bacterium]